jgi:hypothetical protein
MLGAAVGSRSSAPFLRARQLSSARLPTHFLPAASRQAIVHRHAVARVYSLGILALQRHQAVVPAPARAVVAALARRFSSGPVSSYDAYLPLENSVPRTEAEDADAESELHVRSASRMPAIGTWPPRAPQPAAAADGPSGTGADPGLPDPFSMPLSQHVPPELRAAEASKGAAAVDVTLHNFEASRQTRKAWRLPV